jgi:hypothetical protein
VPDRPSLRRDNQAFKTHDPVLAAVLVVAAASVVRLWIMPLANSFWLDETLIVWTIRDGLRQIVPNASISLQSISFCWLEWLISRVLHPSEISLRLLSVAAAISSLYIYYRIGAEFIDRESGLIFSALYILLPQVAFEAPDARPYSLALLGHAAALLWLLRWTRSGRVGQGLLWILCAVVACYLQQLFVFGLAIEGAFVLGRMHSTPAIRPRQVWICGATAILLLLPWVPQALVMSRQAQLLSFAEAPTFTALLFAIAPVYLLAAAALIALLARVDRQPWRWAGIQWGSGVTVLGMLLLFVPVLGLFLISRLTGVRLFDARYLLPAVPGLVFLWGPLLRAVEPAFFRRLTLIAGLIACTLAVGRFSAVPHYRSEDWRAAVKSLPSSGAVLVYSGLVESRRLDWLREQDHWGYLFAPILAYRASVKQEDGFLIPFEFATQERAYLDQLADSQLRNRETVTIIVKRIFWGPAWLTWISGRLGAAGFQKTSDIPYGNVEVAVFRRG